MSPRIAELRAGGVRKQFWRAGESPAEAVLSQGMPPPLASNSDRSLTKSLGAGDGQ